MWAGDGAVWKATPIEHETQPSLEHFGTGTWYDISSFLVPKIDYQFLAPPKPVTRTSWEKGANPDDRLQGIEKSDSNEDNVFTTNGF